MIYDKVTVSVIIPFYKNIDWLKEAIESVLSQTFKPFEIIIINDGSPEDISDFISKYKFHIKYIQKKNEGPAKARNLGIERSSGDYIAFLDSDDIWLPEKIETQLKLMIENSSVWSQTSYYTFKNEDKLNLRTYELKDTSSYNGKIYPLTLASNPIGTPCVMIKGDMIRQDKNLRFNSNMQYGEDSYLWINLALKYPLLSVKDPLTLVRIRGENAALNIKVQLQAKAEIGQIIKKNKNLYHFNTLPIILKIAFNISILSNEILKIFEKKMQKKIRAKIVWSCFYFVPWILFKTYAKTYFKIKRLE